LDPFIFAGGKTLPEEAKVNTIAWLPLANYRAYVVKDKRYHAIPYGGV